MDELEGDVMYKVLLVDQNTNVDIRQVRQGHPSRIPMKGEHIIVKWQEQTRICEVEDVWTNLNFDSQPPEQGAVQVVVRWVTGIDPALYVRRFR